MKKSSKFLPVCSTFIQFHNGSGKHWLHYGFSLPVLFIKIHLYVWKQHFIMNIIFICMIEPIVLIYSYFHSVYLYFLLIQIGDISLLNQTLCHHLTHVRSIKSLFLLIMRVSPVMCLYHVLIGQLARALHLMSLFSFYFMIEIIWHNNICRSSVGLCGFQNIYF